MTMFTRAHTWVDENAQPIGPTVALLGLAALYLGALAWAWQHTSYDVWGAILIAPLLLALTYPVARYAAHIERDPTMTRLILAAFVLKLGMTIVRYVVAFGVYGGRSDAKVYHQIGRQLARNFRSGDLDTEGAALSGTGFIRIFTGVLYSITGPTMIGGYLIYSFIGFWGLYLFYRAFRIAVPDGDRKRYARLVFFLPSMMFWPSSIGKEAWMCLMLGIATLGAAKALSHQRGAFALMAVGITGGAFVRPHVMLIFFIGLSVGYLLREGRRDTVLGVLPKIAGIVALVAVGVVLLGQVEKFFGVDDLSQGGATQALEVAADRSDKGGSLYTAVDPTSPGRYAWAVVTVLFRPFPNEAGNLQSLLASVEGLVVAVLCLLSLPRSRFLLWNLRRWSFGVLSLVYILLFCYAFASIGNFGILTRQRVQVLPFVLALVCLPATQRAPRAQPDLPPAVEPVGARH